jgi:hypothetical protein
MKRRAIDAEEVMSVRFTSRWLRLLAIALMTGGGNQLVEAQTRPVPGTIDGVVTDTSLLPLPDARASILGTSLQVVTGESGRFRILAVPPGHYILIVRRLGFTPTSASLQVAGGDTLRMSFALLRSMTALAPRLALGVRLRVRGC